MIRLAGLVEMEALRSAWASENKGLVRLKAALAVKALRISGADLTAPHPIFSMISSTLARSRSA